MTKEEKLVVIDSLAEQLNEYPHFYLTDIEGFECRADCVVASQVLRKRHQAGGRKEHASCQSAGAGGESGC